MAVPDEEIAKKRIAQYYLATLAFMMKAAEQGVDPFVLTESMYKNAHDVWRCIQVLMGAFNFPGEIVPGDIGLPLDRILDNLDELQQKDMLDRVWDRFANAAGLANVEDRKAKEWDPSKPRMIIAFDEAMQMTKGAVDLIRISNEVLSWFYRGVFAYYIDTDTAVIAHMRGEV
jgi:hypothetical protein